jgi:outer membrane protein OmpA-like peptidoglycan-associated protein
MNKNLIICFCIFEFALSCSNPKQIISFKSSAYDIQQGDSLILNWDVENVSKLQHVYLAGLNKDLNHTGSLTLKPDSSSSYILVADILDEKPLKKKIKINVKTPVIEYFKGTDSTDDESKFNLEWNTENVDFIKIEGIKDSLPRHGLLPVRIDTTTVFRMTAANKNGISVEKDCKVKIILNESFTGPDFVYRGDSALLSWKIKKTGSVKIDELNQSFAPISHISTFPLDLVEYHLTAVRNNGDTIHKVKTVNVIEPFVEYFEGPLTVFKGDNVLLSWKVNGTKKIKIDNLNKEFPAEGNLKIKADTMNEFNLSFPCLDESGKYFIKKDKLKILIIERRFVTGQKSFKKLKSTQRMDFDIFSIDRSHFPDSMTLLVLVVDTAGNFISDLAPPNMSEKESKKYFKKIVEYVEGKSYPVKEMKIREVKGNQTGPSDIALTLDYSGSMVENINNLDLYTKMLIENKNPDDGMAVVRFDDSIGIESPLVKDKETLLKNVKFVGLGPYGKNTALYAAADAGISLLDSSKNNKEEILFTDGAENASILYLGKRATTVMELLQKARQSGTRINVISFGDGTNLNVLEYIAEIADGKCYEINRPSDIRKAFNEMVHNTHNYYEIKYKPANTKEGQRKIQLIYNDQINPNAVAKRETFIGNHYHIDEFASDDNNKWLDSLCYKYKLRPLAPPQSFLFDFDKSNLMVEHVSRLLKYVDLVKKDSAIQVVLLGHSDLVGSERRCLEISQQRADTIKDCMIRQGISEKRIKTVACSKSHPVWFNEDEPWKAHENRRVDVLMLK